MKKKKILYLHQYFRLPTESGGTRIYNIALELTKHGYDVTVITQKNSFNPENKDAKRLEKIKIDGINIIYIRNAYANEFSLLRRFYSFLRFMLLSTWYALKEKKVSLIIATSTPLSIGFPALILHFLKKIPFVFEVRDLWPEGPIQLGIIKNKYLIKILEAFERLIYIRAVHIVALSPGMAEGIKKHVSNEKVTVISNMAKNDIFYSSDKNKDDEIRFGLTKDSFRPIYFGQMGITNAIDYLLDVIKLTNEKEAEGIEFIIAGRGKFYSVIENEITLNGWTNVKLFHRVPYMELPKLLNLCDISLVTFSDIPILKTNSPNKFFESLSAGLPIIVNSDGWTKDIIEQAECGFYVDPKNPMDLTSKIIHLSKNKEILRGMGNNARILAELKYDKSILCKQFKDLIDSLILNHN